MHTPTLTPIFLTEQQTSRLPAATLTQTEGMWLWQHHSAALHIEFPSPKSDQQWLLTPTSWVGQLPLPGGKVLYLQPKLPLRTLFQMLGWAYGLHGLRFLHGVVPTETLPEFVGLLAGKLAEGVLQRLRQGLYHTYIEQSGRPAAVRGQIQIERLARTPTAHPLPCRFTEHSADVPHNQLLAYTLGLLRRLPGLGAEVRHQVGLAYRGLRGISQRPFTLSDLDQLSYTRLNADYRLLHTLCRFFLANLSPGQLQGDSQMIPFLVHMPALFERAVAGWLAAHLPPPYRLQTQAGMTVGERGQLRVIPDLLIRDASGRPLLVLDTKYKTPLTPSPEDVYQITFYAHSLHTCREAGLIYPQPLRQPLDDTFRDVHLRTLVFPLDRDFEAAGESFLGQLDQLSISA